MLMKKNIIDQFKKNGFVNLGKVFNKKEIENFSKMIDEDKENYPNFWRNYGHHQVANYDPLISSPQIDELIRHPKIIPTIEYLMGGKISFSEIGLRIMYPYDGDYHQSWHRDRPHWFEHPLRMDYIQLIAYFENVDETTHCFSLSPESINEDILDEKDAQLKRNGEYHLHRPAGTCALFNVSLFHTATTRKTNSTRKTAQIYYGHRNRPYLANDSAIPATLWRDHPDKETRDFYGVLNERTNLFSKAYPKNITK